MTLNGQNPYAIAGNQKVHIWGAMFVFVLLIYLFSHINSSCTCSCCQAVNDLIMDDVITVVPTLSASHDGRSQLRHLLRLNINTHQVVYYTDVV